MDEAGGKVKGEQASKMAKWHAHRGKEGGKYEEISE